MLFNENVTVHLFPHPPVIAGLTKHTPNFTPLPEGADREGNYFLPEL
jgi:hypothetical protein